MIASARTAPSRRHSRPAPAWHAGFLRMLPKIVQHVRIILPCLGHEARDEAIAECIANAAVAYARLAELDKESLAYPTVLAMYAVRQLRDGRRVGTSVNVHEVLSEYAQRRKRFNVESLERFDEQEGEWQEAVVQDTRSAPVPDIVSFRIDFADWLRDLPRRNRRIAENLALGHSTGEAAKKFKVSPGRISQLRRELHDSWRDFVGEMNEAETAAV